MEKQTIYLVTLAEPDWYTGDLPRQVWLTCFSAMLLSPEDLEESIIALHRAKIIILYGDLPYFQTSNLSVRSTLSGLQIESKNDSLWKNTGEGWWMLLLQPYQVPPGIEDRRLLLERRAEILGMIAALLGRNLCYERVFEYSINIESRECGAFTNYIRVPATMPKPRIDKETLRLMENIDKSIIAAGGSGNRYRLALRWYQRAGAPTGVDALLYHWVALEILAMEDTTNVAPLVALLSKGYSESEQWIRDTFHIGRLHGLRGRIVHDGLDVPVDSRLLDFLEALFTDVLSTLMGVPCPKKALDFLSTQKVSLLQIMPMQE